MANKRISTLDDITSVGGTSTAEVNANDILPITDVDDTTGSPQGTTKGVKVSDLMGEAAVQSVAGRTGAVTIANTDVSGLGTAATTASTDYATSAQGTTADSAVQPAGIANMVETTDSIDVLADVDTSTVAPTNGQALVWDNTAGQWEPGPAGASTLDDLSDVTITSASNEDVIKFNGTSFVNGQASVDVDTPLNTALRGTDNPHIGAYPNQSFKVTDNPAKSVMVIADADGNLDFLVKSDSANIYLNTPSARKAASFGFSVVEDSTEPDIEVVGTLGGASENYSVISGDSDSLGANGFPIRQGFNLPDIGANPAPILISGGLIA